MSTTDNCNDNYATKFFRTLTCYLFDSYSDEWKSSLVTHGWIIYMAHNSFRACPIIGKWGAYFDDLYLSEAYSFLFLKEVRNISSTLIKEKHFANEHYIHAKID